MPAELFTAPSKEAQFLLRHCAWLVSPADGRGHLLSRFLRMVLVAPFTQLTFVSFDLQAFLFAVFHRSVGARVGHLVGMVMVNFFLLVALAAWPIAAAPVGEGLNLAYVYAAIQLVWYAVVARTAGLWGWYALTAPLVLGLLWGALGYQAAMAEQATTGGTGTPLAFTGVLGPWGWTVVGAAICALSHAFEDKLPPRAATGARWLTVRDFVLGPAGAPHPPATVLANAARTGMFLVWGVMDEWWASLRLMPYNLLLPMLRLGYAPELSALLDDRAQRAVQSGNPALDYVGIGGATMLRPLARPLARRTDGAV